LDVGNSGTTMRILAGIASSLCENITITGDHSIQKRPMAPLLNALEDLGVACSSRSGLPPVTVRGPIRGGETEINGSMSSQFISSLLMAAPLAEGDVKISVLGRLLSRPYVEVTLNMMQRFGIDYKRNGDSFEIRSGQPYSNTDYTVPGDFSSAAFPLAAAALAGEVTITGLDLQDPQGDKAILDILRRMGADVRVSGHQVTVAQSELLGLDVDMGDIPDLFPITAVLASTAIGESRLHGAPQLRYKESDRIKHTVIMLQNMGADIVETDDGCIIRGVPRLKGSWVDPVDDHRLMMAAAVASLASDEAMAVKDSECHSVSYPSFLQDMRSIGLQWRELR
jgi:3-phosphoshikimate 1-carboxyvinyltransferase